MSRLRMVVPGEDGTPLTFAEAARAALERALAKGAVALTIVFEKPGREYDDETVPPSCALMVGLLTEYASVVVVREEG